MEGRTQRRAMKNKVLRHILKKEKWVLVENVNDFENFLKSLDENWKLQGGIKPPDFTDWVNHYYEHLLKEPGPLSGPIFS